MYIPYYNNYNNYSLPQRNPQNKNDENEIEIKFSFSFLSFFSLSRLSGELLLLLVVVVVVLVGEGDIVVSWGWVLRTAGGMGVDYSRGGFEKESFFVATVDFLGFGFFGVGGWVGATLN